MDREFRVYKPKSSGGSALKLQFRVKKKLGGTYPEPMLFLEIAKQTGKDEKGNSKFDWASNKDTYQGQSVTMKLGIPDVSELLIMLGGDKDAVGPPAKAGQKTGPGLFHKNANGNTVLKFGKMPGDYGGYAAQLSTSRECSYRIGLTPGEGKVLQILLERFVILFYGWSDPTGVKET